MKIKGHFLALGLVFYADYLWLLFIASLEQYFGFGTLIKVTLMVLFFYLAFREENNKEEKQDE